MPAWTIATGIFVAYVLVTVAVDGRPPAAARRKAAAWALGAGGAALWGAFDPRFWVSLVLLPPSALLMAYWSTGALWTGPMRRVEAVLERSDLALRIPQAAAATPRLMVELLELAYLFVYPLVPVALWLQYRYAPAPDADRFWSVVLVTDFICMGLLPWIQTRPPRALDPTPPWRSTVRELNMTVLGRGSIGVNTFPSGHAAEALACALLLLGAPAPVMAGMFVTALLISAGAVFGRYHYAIDALLGWAVAAAVWALWPAGAP